MICLTVLQFLGILCIQIFTTIITPWRTFSLPSSFEADIIVTLGREGMLGFILLSVTLKSQEPMLKPKYFSRWSCTL